MLGTRLTSFFYGTDLKNRLLRGGAGSAGIQVANRLTGLALGVVLARGLGAEGYGVYAYALAIMNLLIIVAEMGVPTLLVREVAHTEGREAWGEMRGVIRRGTQIVALISVLVALIGLGSVWSGLFPGDPQKRVTMSLMFGLLPLTALGRTGAAVLRGMQRVVYGQFLALLLRPLAVLLSLGGLFFLFPGLRDPAVAMGAQVGAAVCVCAAGFGLIHHFYPRSARGREPVFHTRQWMKSALPFTLISASMVLNSQTDIVMLGFLATKTDVGLYRVAMQGGLFVAFAFQAANSVLAPQFSRFYGRGEMAGLQRLATAGARISFVLGLPVALILFAAGGPLMGWIFGEAFSESYGPLCILAGGQLVALAAGLVGFLLNMTGYERLVARRLLQTATLNIILNAVLIPLYGLYGAATASAFSQIFLNALLAVAVFRRLHINPTIFSRRALLAGFSKEEQDTRGAE